MADAAVLSTPALWAAATVVGLLAAATVAGLIAAATTVVGLVGVAGRADGTALAGLGMDGAEGTALLAVLAGVVDSGSVRRRRISWPTRGLMAAISFPASAISAAALFCDSAAASEGAGTAGLKFVGQSKGLPTAKP